MCPYGATWVGNITDVVDVNRFNNQIIRGEHYAKITGSILVHDTDIETMNMPELCYVSGAVSVDNAPYLTEISFPELLVVGEYMDIKNNDILETIAVPDLESVVGVVFDNNDSLTEISFPQTSSVGPLDVSNNAVLTRMSFPKMTISNGVRRADITDANLGYFGGTLAIRNNSALTTIALPQLATMDHSILLVSDNDSLTTLSLPLLSTGARLTIDNNDALTTLALPRLTHVANMNILNNQQIQSLEFPVLVSSYGAVIITNNGSLATISYPLLEVIGRLGRTGDQIFDEIVLYVSNNNTLHSVSFPRLTTVDTQIIFHHNGNLCTTITRNHFANAVPSTQGYSMRTYSNKLDC